MHFITQIAIKIIFISVLRNNLWFQNQVYVIKRTRLTENYILNICKYTYRWCSNTKDARTVFLWGNVIENEVIYRVLREVRVIGLFWIHGSNENWIDFR